MRLLDIIRGTARDKRDLEELQSLWRKLNTGKENRGAVIRTVLLPDLAGDILDFEGVYSPWELPQQPTLPEIVQLTTRFKQLLTLREGERITSALTQLLAPLHKNLPTLPEGEEFGLSVSLLELLPNPVAIIDGIVRASLTSPLPHLQGVIRNNLLIASKIDPHFPTNRPLIMPAEAKAETLAALVETYLRGTPFADFLQTPHPFFIPSRARFEHTHIVGGSGHGKTQLLQTLILRDLDKLRAGEGSIVIIDSQGDMIRTVLHLADMQALSDRLVLIDPNDIDYPPCLNLFDFGLDRLAQYSSTEREKLINGAIALYEYLFGALLGADLTMRQGVIFRYLARLMMTVPGGTIHTIIQFVEDPETTRQHLGKLDRLSRHFFETQFFSPAFKDTRQQILARLWGVVSNSVLERMFANEKNKLDLFDAMNRGSIILINTAKDLLKQEGCEILGRFFIAFICQAAQERASIREEQRRSTFLYIDEAHDYFDESMENLLNQARKYKVGLILANQNLDQFEKKLRSTVMASTSLKIAGDLSAGDAGVFAKEMRCEREFLQDMRKHSDHTEFACFIRNHTQQPVRLSVPFGEMEKKLRLTDAEYETLLMNNRTRYCATQTEQRENVPPKEESPTGFILGKQEVL